MSLRIEKEQRHSDRLILVNLMDILHDLEEF